MTKPDIAQLMEVYTELVTLKERCRCLTEENQRLWALVEARVPQPRPPVAHRIPHFYTTA